MRSPDEQALSSGWSGRERAALAFLVLLLLLLCLLRVHTRRPDSGRGPQRPDVLVLHPAGLRADSVPRQQLAADLGLAPEDVLAWTNAFAHSTDPVRSAIAAMSGDLVTSARWPRGGQTVPERLGAAGYSRLLVDSGALARAAGNAFDQVLSVTDDAGAAARFGAAWSALPAGPRFAFVQLGNSGEPLHAQTTEASVLEGRHRLLVDALRGHISAIVVAAQDRRRPLLVVLLGASGAELGEHPRHPDRPYEPALRVPFLFGLLQGRGLPVGHDATLVQGMDLGPTLLDLLDLRGPDERAGDGVQRFGHSLEGLAQGWEQGPLHEALIHTAPGYAAIRSEDWKLICPLDAQGMTRPDGCELYALQDDPGERQDLLAGRAIGPASSELLRALNRALIRAAGSKP